MQLKYLLNWLSVLLVLFCNLEASAQNYILRYVNTDSGAVTFTGNTLGLNKATGVNAPGGLGSIGAFITLNTNLAVGAYGPGTTLNWSNNSSSAVLRMPTNSTVLYAELIWAGTAELATNSPLNSSSNVLNYLNNSVQFIMPDGSTNSITPDPATASVVTNFNTGVQGATFYLRSANVTALVQSAGVGTYSVGGVPATIAASEDANNACGWTLAVVYENSSFHQRNLSLFVGQNWVNAAGGPPPVGVTGFCAPPTGPVNGYLFVSGIEGDPQNTGDKLLFGTDTNSLSVLSGPNNLPTNFFASQINYCQPDSAAWNPSITNGTLDTSGTFGFSNSIPLATSGTEPVSGGRQGWDITCVNVSSALTNGSTSAYAQFVTSGDGYSVDALALQIDVGSPVLATTQSVDKASTYIGDTLTYTVVVTNSGTADAVNLIFTDPLAFGTSFIANTFKTNGVVISGANPVTGVPINIIKQNSSLTLTYQVLVNEVPQSAKFVTAATIDFQFSGPCALSPIINGTLVNLDVNTYIPVLGVNKVASLTNVVPGAALTYAINVPNTGSTNTANSTLVDPIPAGVFYVTNTTRLNGVSIADIGGTNMPYTVQREIHSPTRPAGQINAGETAVVTFQVTISSNPPARIFNSATIFMNSSFPSSSQSADAYLPPVYSDLAAGITGNPNPVSAGSPFNLTISVTNKGPNSISDATNFVTLSLPLDSSILSPVFTPSVGTYNPLNGVWSGVTLPSNGVITLTVTGQIDPTASAGSVVSSVTVAPPPGVIDINSTNNSASFTNAVVQVADLAATINDGVTNVAPGTALTYTITAINLGPSTLNSIAVSNFVSPFLTNVTFNPNQGTYNSANGAWSGLNLASGGSVVLTMQATVLTNASGLFTNASIVFVPTGVTDPVSTNNAASDVDDALVPTDLAIFKSGPANVVAGTSYNYAITATNAGSVTASNVVVSDVLPVGVSFVSASGNGTTNAGAVIWNLGNLAVNGRSNLTLTVIAPAGGNITNVAIVTSTTPDTNSLNNTSPPVGTTVTPSADIVLLNTGPTNVVAGTLYTNTVTVTNAGPSTATNLVLVDTLPNGSQVTNLIPVLPAGGSTNFPVVLTAPGSGPLTNSASSSAGTPDPNPANNSSISLVTTISPSANLSVGKTGPSSIFAGTNFIYTISVTNLGPSTATGLLVTDSLPANLIFVSGTPVATTNAANQVIWTNVNSLAPGAITNLTLNARATSRGTVTNLATVGSATPDSILTNNVSPPVFTAVTNIPPVVVNDSGSTARNTPVTIPVLSNDSDPGGFPLAIVGVSATNGTVIVSGTNVVYTPPNALGTNNIVYTVSDGSGGTNSGLITVAVTNRPPVASNDTAVAGVGVPVTVPVLSNDSDPDGDSLTIVGVSATNGTAVISGTNVVFTPTTNLTGTVLYTISDGFGGTNSALVTVTATNTTLPADIQVFLFGPTNVTVGDGFSYTIVVTNAGPGTAVNTLAQDVLPTNLVFGSASGGGTFSNSIVTWPVIPVLTNGQATNLTLTVTPSAFGSANLDQTNNPNPFNFIQTNTASIFGYLTNIASAFSATFDPNLTNNTGTLSPLAQVQTVIVPGVFSVFISTNTYATNSSGYNLTNTIIPLGPNLFIVGTSAFNPQTGLYEETVSVTNIGTAPVHALRVYINGAGGIPVPLRSGVSLYDATGTNSLGQYVEYDPPYNSPLLSGGNVSFLLEFYVSDRRPFTNSLTAVAVLAPPAATVSGTPVSVSRLQILNGGGGPRYLVQFNTIPGRTYTILYSDDLITWTAAVPSIVASANGTQWYDGGPPETVSNPASVSRRFYQVILDP